MFVNPWIKAAAGTAVLIVLTAALLYGMGRVPVCDCGVVRVWSGDINSNENSQQFSDPYTFTHIIHGVLFYGLVWIVFRDKHPATRLLIAVAIEAAWEALENTSYVIERYRQATISLDYYGDSVLNSVSDILAMVLGFLLAWRLPVKVTVIGTIAVDLALLFFIRDSLALNIIMLIYPSESIRQWQMYGTAVRLLTRFLSGDSQFVSNAE
jgi:hypothetical protein